MNRGITRVADRSRSCCSSRSSSARRTGRCGRRASLAERQDNAIQARRAVHDQARARSSADGKTDLRDERAAEGRRARRSTSASTRSGGLLAQTSSATRRRRASAPGSSASLNDYLTGDELEPEHGHPHERSTGSRATTITGNNVVAHDRTGARSGSPQRRARHAVRRRVAMEPATGKVLVLASSPTYDPNLAEDNFDAIRRIKANCRPGRRRSSTAATAALFPPGSTFKVVTAAAALDTGRYTPESHVLRPGLLHRVRQAGARTPATRRARSTFGHARPSTRRSSTRSTRCSARSASRLGREDDPRLRQALRLLLAPAARDAGERARDSGLYKQRTSSSTPRTTSQVDPGRLAFGQERMHGDAACRWRWSPPAIANGGVVMRPYVVERIERRTARLVTRTSPEDPEPRDQAADGRAR